MRKDRLLLVTTVYTGDVPPRDLTTEEIRNAVSQAANFYKCGCEGLHTKIEPSNSEASDLARRIFEIHDRIEVLRVVLISDGMTSLESLDIKDAKDGTRVLVDLYGIERLRRILGDGLTRDDIVLDVVAETGMPLACLKASSGNCDYDAYVTAIPASLLADVYDKYGTRLLELNVRAFLGVRGRKSVNAGLRRTILEEPGHFLAYNNGIVATADEIDVSDAGGKLGINTMGGLQIVNGGQTRASLHRARKQDKTGLEGILVPAKNIKVKAENLDAMVAAVSRSANSQNTIQPADFSANDPFHVAVETLTNNTWLPDQSGRWSYERARGSYSAAELKASFRASEKRRFGNETPKERRFSKTDLAKYLTAWDGLPYLVSFGNQKNFQSLMQRMKEQYPDGFVPDEGWFRAFIAKAIVFRTVQAIVRARKFSAYQANITAYTVACLSWKSGGRIDFERIWSHQSVSKELRAMIDKWVGEIDRHLRDSAKSRMPSEWAKKAECWEAIRDVSLQLPDPLPPELQVQHAKPSAPGMRAGKSNDGLSREDLELIERCHRVEAATWFKVAQWGAKSKAINWKLAGIAKTVGEYAIGGWERGPSAKQAKWAMEAYRTAEEAGILQLGGAAR
jgi:AIPR protein